MTNKRERPTDAEFAQYMTADAATVSGGNTAYGNTSRNSGARLVPAPEPERKKGRRSE